jgi:hypothetical protein
MRCWHEGLRQFIRLVCAFAWPDLAWVIDRSLKPTSTGMIVSDVTAWPKPAIYSHGTPCA